MATDTYARLVNSDLGTRVAGAVGLPRPAVLRRHTVGAPLIPGAVVVGGPGSAPVGRVVRRILAAEGIEVLDGVTSGSRVGGVVADLTDIATPADLESLRALVAPTLRGLAPSGRVIVVGRPPETATDVAQAAARRALEGISRSLGKELRAGATANLVLVKEGAEAGAESTLRYLLSGRSAYVGGQVFQVGAGSVTEGGSWDQPLAGKVAVVTGAARGIGASIAEVLHRDGATVVCVDVPSAGDALARVANRLGGTALPLDVTAADAGQRMVQHANARHGGLDIVVHNAGITRDRLLANTDEDRWGAVLDVNLLSILAMNEALLAPGGVRDHGRIVCVSSMAGIAGNRGQANYAASKAGVIGMVQALAREGSVVGRGITVNAVAPGFIETDMTAKIPLTTREAGRRMNSMTQGGLPLDVAETIGYFAWGSSWAVNGNVVRVCGQSLLGA